MNTLNDKHYISIPRKEFEEMERNVENKKDIRIEFILTYSPNSHWLPEILLRSNITFDHYSSGNDASHKVNLCEFFETKKIVEKACNKIVEEKNHEIEEIKQAYKQISSNWLFKFLKRFYNGSKAI